jgi:hypothetical protein
MRSQIVGLDPNPVAVLLIELITIIVFLRNRLPVRVQPREEATDYDNGALCVHHLRTSFRMALMKLVL